MTTIAYLTPQYFDDKSYVGGGERYPLNLAMGVAESTPKDMQIRILSFGPEPFVRELHPGVTLRVMQAAYTPRHPLDQLSWEIVDALNDVDLVHIMQAHTRCSEVGYLVSQMLDKPICVTDMGGYSSSLGQSFDAHHLIDCIICYSDFGAQMMRASRQLVTIKGGVDSRLFVPPVGKPKRDRILYVGRLLPHKGIDQLIQALPEGLALTCCGRPYHPEYFQLLQKLSRNKEVDFILDADDKTIRKLYGKAFAVVLPSVYRDCYGQSYVAPELMGLTLLEAMACGTPAICNRVAAMPEFVRQGETGFVYDNLEELTGYLKRVSTEADLPDQMGRAARKLVETEFDMRVCGQKLASIYRQILRARKAQDTLREAA